jgi:AraC family transcriptional regulator of adaptative response / DNA-3-methyladenine glycosylase II
MRQKGMPSPDECYRAYLAKDPRFDGAFFVGITTTGIYCRATCTARAPKRENCVFFPTAAAAEEAGFRPCLRCRPELAPGMPAQTEGSALAQRAAEMIRTGVAHGSIATIARRLGISERHLRRLFETEFGTSPAQYRSTCRLLLAKSLLTDSDLPVSQVAHAAGFESIRRFNDELRARYGLSPTDMRRQANGVGKQGDEPAEQGILVQMGFRPPMRFDLLLGFLAGRAIAGVESVVDGCYRRSLRIVDDDGRVHLGWVSVGCDEARSRLRCRVSPSLVDVLPQVIGLIGRIFDTSCSPEDVDAGLEGFWDVVGEGYRRPGIRLPGCADAFEMGCRAILGQQITVRAASTLAGRVAASFGEAVETPFDDVTLAFPTPEVLAADGCEEALGELGVTRQKQKAIRALAQGLADGSLALEPGVDVAETHDALVSLPGIGEWTAQYLLMRACSYPDALPAADYAVRQAFPGMRPREVERLSESWRPWRSYAVMALWQVPA